jgi:acetyltransferase
VIGLDGPADEVENGCRAAAGYGLPAVVGARALSTSVRVLVEDARQRDAQLPGPATGIRPEDSTQVRLPRRSWTEAQAKDALDLVGVPTPPRAVCHTLAEARAALDRIGGPVVVKLSDADVIHKSDSGGVHLGVRTRAELSSAVNSLTEIGAEAMLVEAMAPPGVDLVVGARRDPVFGPVVLLGIGGVATEVYADVAIAAVPAPLRQLVAMPEQLSARQLLDGFRGAAPVDREALAQVMRLIGDLLIANPHIDEIEINPLRAHAGGLVALDAVIVEGALAETNDRGVNA